MLGMGMNVIITYIVVNIITIILMNKNIVKSKQLYNIANYTQIIKSYIKHIT